METLTAYMNRTKPKGFQPMPHYSVEGDSLTFFFRDEPFCRERVDDFLTVYKSDKSGELVGCQIKGLPKVLKLLGDFDLSIAEHGEVRMKWVFMACMAASPDRDTKQIYIDVAKAAPEASIKACEVPAAA